jgi:hypothetical protein
VLHTGARPGLAVALLLPLVRACEDEIRVIREARVLWLGITALALAGLGAWLAQLEPDPARRRRTALLGVALLALVPAFLETSLQVRTDQLALAGGAWGGACLLASRRRAALALAAGAGFGAGWFGTQKLLMSRRSPRCSPRDPRCALRSAAVASSRARAASRSGPRSCSQRGAPASAAFVVPAGHAARSMAPAGVGAQLPDVFASTERRSAIRSISRSCRRRAAPRAVRR